MPRPPLTATLLSDYSPSGTKMSRVFRLARLSLLAGVLSMLTSCLIDDPPPYIPPERTPPRLDHYKAFPPTDLVITATKNDLLTFTIPVASEDAGEDLTAQFFLDAQFLDYVTIPASTLDDKSRSASFSFPVIAGLGGCHLFKIRVAHAINLPGGNVSPTDPDDVAVANWLVNIDLPDGEQGMLNSCPTASGVAR